MTPTALPAHMSARLFARLLARPAFLRYLGLFGSVCVAIDGCLLGAARDLRPNVSVATIATGPRGPLILTLWIVGLTCLCVAWWHGRHLVGRGAVTTRWVLVTALLWIVPMLVIPPLGSRDVYAYACQGALYDSGRNPYTQSISDQPCPWLLSVSPVWRTTSTPYGPIFIVLSGLAASLGSQAAAIMAYRVLAVLGLVATAACLPSLARRLGVPADRAAWLLLCCPLVPVHMVGGAHNDALTVAFMVAGLAVLARAARAPDGESESGGFARGRLGRAFARGELAGAARGGYGALATGGMLLGCAFSIKITLGVMLPFAALLAVGPVFQAPGGLTASGMPPEGLTLGRLTLDRLAPGGVRALVTRGGTVIVAALATLVGLSYASGLGMGWIGAMSDAGHSRNWTSPPTAVGLAIHSVVRFFGPRPDFVPWTRVVALAVLAVVLVAILWRSRASDPLYGGALALLALIFLAPIAQPWYLMWALALIAVTRARARWLAITVVISMFTILPDGDGALKPLRTPLSYAMTALVLYAGVRLVRWLRGAKPALDVTTAPGVMPSLGAEPVRGAEGMTGISDMSPGAIR